MSATNQATINDLPVEMLCEVFGHLFNPFDLAACLMVNKLWHSICAGLKMNSLAVRHNSLDAIRYQYPDLKLKEKDLCNLKLLTDLADKPLISDLKHLALIINQHPEFDVNKLNAFSKLLRLDIYIMTFRYGKAAKFNFPSLKILTYKFTENLPIWIDCPSLIELTLIYRQPQNTPFVYDRMRLVVKHPETIKKLETNTRWFTDLAPFTNVECLTAWRFEVISKYLLEWLPKLKEFRCNENIRNILRRNHMDLQQIKQTLREFVNDVNALKEHEFVFVFAGFPLTKISVDKIKFSVQPRNGIENVQNEYLYMKNYQLLDTNCTLRFINRLDYNCLMTHSSGQIPSGFSEKFTGLKWVNVLGGVQNAGHLFWFLRSLKSPICLFLSKTELSKKFAYRPLLSAYSHALLDSRVYEGNPLQLNCTQISELSSNLVGLSIRHPGLPFETLAPLVRLFGKSSMQFLDFKFRGKRFYIERSQSKRLSMYRYRISLKKLLLETENVEKIVDFVATLYGSKLNVLAFWLALLPLFLRLCSRLAHKLMAMGSIKK